MQIQVELLAPAILASCKVQGASPPVSAHQHLTKLAGADARGAGAGRMNLPIMNAAEN